MKRQRKFAIVGITGAMLVGAGTGAVLNMPAGAGASGNSVAVTATTVSATTDAATGSSGTATTPADSGTPTPPAAGRVGRGEFIKTQLDALVTAGTITQGQEDTILAGIEAARPTPADRNGTAGGDRGPRMGGPGMGGHRMGGRRAGLDAAATALGVTSAELKTELKAGKTIADVATDKGIDVQTVIDAMVVEQTANITERVTNEVNGVKPTPPADAPTPTTDATTGTTTG